MSQMYKKVNRRNNVFNHLNRNVVYPSLFLSSDEFNKQSSVEIIELKSDEESEKKQRDKSDYSHVWCSENDEQETSYRINKEARERRGRRVEYGNDEIYNELFDRMCTKFYGIKCHNSHDAASNDRDAKCFSIINNLISYDTSSDDDVEAEYSDTLLNRNSTNEKSFHGDDSYTNEYDEKRTVWIYSEKNKKELSDDYELKNSSTSSSTTDNEEPIRDINIGYIRRPIPTYIPKLFLPLSPTLPTVTEVMESYNKSSSNTEINQSKSMTPQMPINNWMQEQSVELQNDLHHKIDNNTFTWDALTPREKRKIKNSMYKEKIDKIGQEPINQSKSSNEDIKEIESQTNEFETLNANQSNDQLRVSSKEEINNLQKPHIKVNGKIKLSREMKTEPLGKENGRWIGEETDDTLNVYDYDLDRNDTAGDRSGSDMAIENLNSASNKFSVTNMSLSKPMEWTQYLPITGSIPSLHLSFETEIEENKSWLMRLFKFFECCKRNNK